MKRGIGLAVVAVLAGLAAPSSAALGSRDKGKVRHAEIQMDQLDKRLAEIPQAPGDRAPVKLTECDQRIQTARADLAQVPAAEPEVQALLARVDEAEKRVANTRADLAKASASNAADVESFKNAVGDGKALSGQETLFQELLGVNGDEGQPAERVARWPQARAEFEAFDKQFGPLAEKASARGGAMQAYVAYAGARDAYRRLEEARQRLGKEGPGRVAAHLAKARTEAGQLATASSGFLATQMSAERALGRAERVTGTYDVMCKDLPGFTGKLMDGVKAARAEVDAQAAKVAARIIAENSPIESTYTGTDRDEVGKAARDAWKRAYPEETVLAVRFPEGWARSTGFRWRDAGSRWEKYDESHMEIVVYVNGKDPAQAIEHRGDAFRLHLEGGKLAVRAGARASDRVSPTRVVLLAKLGAR